MSEIKKVVFIGKNSYIGTCCQEWMKKQCPDWQMFSLSSRDDSWSTYDFSDTDSVVFVAGIAHRKETKENKELYYKVNCDLAVNCCKRAADAGVKQFIYLSSQSVFGQKQKDRKVVITKDTVLSPNTTYGKSKMKAEQELESLELANMKLAIVRPPMVYGKGAKGNYVRLASFAMKLPFFPKVKNERSMIFIDNLSECIRLIILNESKGYFHPQNREYVCTSNLVKTIANAHHKKLFLVAGFQWLIGLVIPRIGIVSKVFGSLVYEKEMSDCFDYQYCVCEFEESILQTESGVQSFK